MRDADWKQDVNVIGGQRTETEIRREELVSSKETFQKTTPSALSARGRIFPRI